MWKATLLITLLSISYTISAPSVSTTESLVISSAEHFEEDAIQENNTKEDAGPKTLKINEMKINTNVSNRFATTLISSKVKNLAQNAQEATFSVVLPETAYISGFVMEIGGKSYKAYVKEKEEAKEIYNKAVASGQSAAHVEANARDSNRFTVSVNVEPQSKAIFKLTYEELLQRQNGQYEIVLNIHPGQPVKDLNVEVHINETRPLKFVRSPPLRTGNEIGKEDDKLDPAAQIDIANTTAAVKFNPNVERQKQLAQGLGTKQENGLAGQFVVQYDVERDPFGGEVLVKDGYFVHFFAPSELTPLPKQVVFVLDTSGSMDGIRIKQLKEAMNSILVELKPDDLFNIIEFSSTVKVWNIKNVEVQYEEGDDMWYHYPEEQQQRKNKTEQVLPPSFEATEENVNKAKEVVEKLSAYGGTDIKSGLEVGLKVVKKNKEEKNSTHQPIIVFLTDGEATVGETRPDTIISAIKELNSGATRCPIFSLSFGDGADRNFLERISLKNSGFARHIYEGADASLQLREFYRQISSPLLSNVTFKYVSNVTKLTKTVFPILFSGSELVVAGKTDIVDEGFNPPIIYCWGVRGPVDLTSKVEQPIGGLERLWAYLTVKQILEDREAADNVTIYTKKALEIALKYSFVTSVSSLVVVKPNDTKADVDTEDASKSVADRPYYAKLASISYNRLGSPQNSPLAYSAGKRRYQISNTQRQTHPIAVPLYTPVLHTISVPTTGLASISSPMQEAEEVDSSTVEISALEMLKNELPWLESVLNENETLKNPPGNYKLGLNETITDTPECPKSPYNGTIGHCTLLSNCPEVFANLTDVSVFVQYFCPLKDEFAGICCPN